MCVCVGGGGGATSSGVAQLGQVEKADTVGHGHGRGDGRGRGHGHEPKLIFQPFAV